VLRVFENKVLRRIFGPKRENVTGGWTKPHNEELKIMKLLIVQFSPPFCSPSSLGPDILLSTLFSSNLNFCFSRSVRDQVSHPYKTTGKNVILYILILKFLERRW
jgi:hypothetical protein